MPESPSLRISRRQALACTAALGAAAAGLSGCAASAGRVDLQGERPVASIAQGRLRGQRFGPVLVFKRIPYAATPFMVENRFLPARLGPAWRDVREAGDFGPSMPPKGGTTAAASRGRASWSSR